MIFLFDVNLLMALLCSAQTMRLRSPQSKQVSRFAAGSQSPVKGRPKTAHGFNRGSRVEKGQSPGGAKENVIRNNPALPSLTGFIRFSHQNPPMNQWAISFRPILLGELVR